MSNYRTILNRSQTNTGFGVVQRVHSDELVAVSRCCGDKMQGRTLTVHCINCGERQGGAYFELACPLRSQFLVGWLHGWTGIEDLEVEIS